MLEDDKKVLEETIPKFLSFRWLQERVKLVDQIHIEVGKDAFKET